LEVEMKLTVCLLALIWSVSVAQAGRNAGGAMIVHTSDGYNYCAAQVCTEPAGNPATCVDANSMATHDTGQVIWVLAYWCPDFNPGVTVVYFGIQYDDTTLDPGEAYRLCGPAGSLEVPDPDWPYAGRGNAVAFGSPVYSTIFPFYVFKINGGTDGSYFGTSINPTGGYAAFVDDSNPPLIDECYLFGTVRWNVHGQNDCPGCGPSPGACCFGDCHCEMLHEPECMAAGATYLGDGTPCDPNPCSCPRACCYPDGVCVLLPEHECLESGGDFQGMIAVCDPNPCPQPGACCLPDGSCVETLEHECQSQGGNFQGAQVPCTPNLCPPTATQPTTWGRIKAVYR
jgi:hypothetical protein